jgi:hypothetical protein
MYSFPKIANEAKLPLASGHLPMLAAALATRGRYERQQGKWKMVKRKSTTLKLDRYGLPPIGDTSLAAVGARLKYVRRQIKASLGHLCHWWQCTPSQWRAWTAGKELIPKPNAWYLYNYSLSLSRYHIRGLQYAFPPVWTYTGDCAEHKQPARVPQLGDDLSGFASRVTEALARLGITYKDFKGHDDYFSPDEIRAFACGLDEPDCDTSIFDLADVLNVSTS